MWAASLPDLKSWSSSVSQAAWHNPGSSLDPQALCATKRLLCQRSSKGTWGQWHSDTYSIKSNHSYTSTANSKQQTFFIFCSGITFEPFGFLLDLFLVKNTSLACAPLQLAPAAADKASTSLPDTARKKRGPPDLVKQSAGAQDGNQDHNASMQHDVALLYLRWAWAFFGWGEGMWSEQLYIYIYTGLTWSWTIHDPCPGHCQTQVISMFALLVCRICTRWFCMKYPHTASFPGQKCRSKNSQTNCFQMQPKTNNKKKTVKKPNKLELTEPSHSSALRVAHPTLREGPPSGR